MSDVAPLTERVLARLPGPHVIWIAAWALVPWLNAGANLLLDADERSSVWDQSNVLVFLSYASFSFAIVMTLWGVERITRRLAALRANTSTVLEVTAHEPFRAVNNVVAPLLLSAATAITLGLIALIQDGWTPAIVRGVTWFVLGLALWTFLWIYVTLQFGLDRLGQARLLPDSSRVDPTLGLRPLGAVAFMGLWMLLAWLVPLLLTSLPDVVGVVLGIAVLSAALAAFFLSLLRLHRQMVKVKASEIAIARGLYAQAYEPVRAAQTLEALERQHSLLSAADALERRAVAIHEWPLEEGLVARVATITTSVIAITVARLLLDPVGL